MSILVFLTLPKLLTESTLQLSYVQETILLRDVPMIVVHIICFCYQSQHMCLQCSNTKLSFSTISNGVRQGGILSTKLFSVYMDDLSDLLINFGIGCFLDKNGTDNIGLHI